MTLESLYFQRFHVHTPHPVGCEPIREIQTLLHPIEDVRLLGPRKAEWSMWLSPRFFGAFRWLHVQLCPIAQFFLINSTLIVILRLIETTHGAETGISDILLGVHCINVMWELEILKVRELPEARFVGPLVRLPISQETIPIGARL